MPLPQAQARRHMSEISMYYVIHVGRIDLSVKTPFVHAALCIGFKWNLVDTFENGDCVVEESSLWSNTYVRVKECRLDISSMALCWWLLYTWVGSVTDCTLMLGQYELLALVTFSVLYTCLRTEKDVCLLTSVGWQSKRELMSYAVETV